MNIVFIVNRKHYYYIDDYDFESIMIDTFEKLKDDKLIEHLEIIDMNDEELSKLEAVRIIS